MEISRPVMIWDGDCGFCRYWVERWGTRLKDRVDFRPSQSFEQLPKGVTRDDCASAVVFVEPSGRVSKGAEAVFRALAQNEDSKWQLALYQKVPGVAPITEAFYRVVAGNRPFFSKLTKKFVK